MMLREAKRVYASLTFLRTDDDAVNDVFVLEIHDEPGILPARDRRLSHGGNLGGRSAEFAGNLIHGHAARWRGHVGLLDGNTIVNGNCLGPREAAREHRG